MAARLTPTEHVGKRIRLYRKKKGYTLVEFSQMIHRSVSAISKYENGNVSIDVDTLFDIAEALGVSVNKLTDYQQPSKIKETAVNRNFFHRSKMFYMYQYSGFDKKINKCQLEVIETDDDSDDKVMLFYGCKDDKDYTNCDYLYRGTISYGDDFVSIHTSNPYNPEDKASIYARSTFSPNDHTVKGIVLTLANSMHNPYAAKVVFSTEPMVVNEELLEKLMINDKDSLAKIKRANALLIY